MAALAADVAVIFDPRYEIGLTQFKVSAATDIYYRGGLAHTVGASGLATLTPAATADFYAGVWAHHAQQMRNILEPGDLESALRAATAIGDDRLQKEAQGYVVPDSFTHGTSAQRVRWFRRGFETGDLEQGDTFNVREL